MIDYYYLEDDEPTVVAPGGFWFSYVVLPQPR